MSRNGAQSRMNARPRPSMTAITAANATKTSTESVERRTIMRATTNAR